MADRRDQKTGDKVAYYDEHGLNQQRAYQIVCLMVGFDDEKFKDLAKETKLPEERQDTCAGDYSNAAYSWDLVLKPHRRAPDQPKTKIDVIYGPAEGRAETAQQVARSIRLLQTVTEHAADEFVWPMPFTLEMQSCDALTPAGTLRPTSLRCVTNSLPNSRTSIATMATCERTARRSADSSKRKTTAWRHSSRTTSRPGANTSSAISRPLKFAVFGTAPRFRSQLGALYCEPSMVVCEFWRCRSSRKQPWQADQDAAWCGCRSRNVAR